MHAVSRALQLIESSLRRVLVVNSRRVKLVPRRFPFVLRLEVLREGRELSFLVVAVVVVVDGGRIVLMREGTDRDTAFGADERMGTRRGGCRDVIEDRVCGGRAGTRGWHREPWCEE